MTYEVAKLININKTYENSRGDNANKTHALKDITMTINKGDFVGVLGKSGSGKSTLMNIIGCLDMPTTGTYMLNGIDILKQKDKRLSQIRGQEIGFIFQGFNLIPSLSAIENVELPLLYQKISKSERMEKAHDMLGKVGLSDRVNYFPNQLSGGQQQRVAIARAIATSPPIILADEPTGNLDNSSTSEIMNILHALNKNGNTIVIITHDEEIAQSIPKVFRINDGYIV